MSEHPIPISESMQREILRLTGDSSVWGSHTSTAQALYGFARFVLAEVRASSLAPVASIEPANEPYLRVVQAQAGFFRVTVHGPDELQELFSDGGARYAVIEIARADTRDEALSKARAWFTSLRDDTPEHRKYAHEQAARDRVAPPSGHTQDEEKGSTRMDKQADSIGAATAPADRAETGPMKFGNDWTGVFIRGDNAAGYAMALQFSVSKLQGFECAALAGLLRLLEGSNEHTATPQLMRPFGEAQAVPAVATPVAEGKADPSRIETSREELSLPPATEPEAIRPTVAETIAELRDLYEHGRSYTVRRVAGQAADHLVRASSPPPPRRRCGGRDL